MDLENQKRVKEFAEKYGPENIVVVLGAAETMLLTRATLAPQKAKPPVWPLRRSPTAIPLLLVR